MKLKTSYDTADEIPEGYADLYTERDGVFVLTGIEGVKAQSDIDRLTDSLKKERSDHKATREKLAAFAGLDPTEVHEKLEEATSLAEQLEAVKKAGGVFDEEKLAPVIEARVRQATAPLERQVAQAQRKLEEKDKLVASHELEVGTLKSSIVNDRIERTIRDVAVAEKVIAPAIGDVVLNARGIFEQDESGRVITKDIDGVTPGLSPKEWLKDQQENRPHWWPVSAGGGARGAGGGGSAGPNPWSKDGWNITAQGAYVNANGIEKATQMADRAGVKIGATKPKAA